MPSEPPTPPDDSPAQQEKSAANRESESIPAESPPNREPVRDGESVSERRALLQLSSAGFELASFSLLLGGAGYAVDHWLGNPTPYFAIAGIVIGFCLGFYRLIVLANKMN